MFHKDILGRQVASPDSGPDDSMLSKAGVGSDPGNVIERTAFMEGWLMHSFIHSFSKHQALGLCKQVSSEPGPVELKTLVGGLGVGDVPARNLS